MERRRNVKNLLLSRILTSSIGAEFEILKKASPVARSRFYLSAVAIFLIFGISFCSIFYAMKLLFHIIQVEIFFSIFFSSLFAFMYVYLLHTFSKDSARWPKKGAVLNWCRQLSISDFIRTIFVIFMAFLISKPIEIFIFQTRLKKEVATYKTQVFDSYKKKIIQLHEVDLQKMKNRILTLEAQNKIFYSPQVAAEIQNINRTKEALETKLDNNLINAQQQIQKSDFMLFQIQRVVRFPLSWLVMTGVVLLFMVPGVLIYFVSPRNDYFKLKHRLEKQIILEEYRLFQTYYTNILSKYTGTAILFHSTFEDPPFNKKPIKAPEAFEQKDFFKKYGLNNS